MSLSRGDGFKGIGGEWGHQGGAQTSVRAGRVVFYSSQQEGLAYEL